MNERIHVGKRRRAMKAGAERPIPRQRSERSWRLSAHQARRGAGHPLVCIVIENNTYPLDRRVALQAHTLVEGGYDVVVIAPAGPGQPLREQDGAIEVRRYHLRPADSAVGYLREYGMALLHITRLLWSVAHERRPDAIQVCNPPDLLFLPVLPLKLLGVRFVFDLHDLMPEIFVTRYTGRGAQMVHPVLRILERVSVVLADATIATNTSYREHVINQDAGRPDRVVVVRTGPTMDRFAAITPHRITDAATLTIGYVGMMAPQDGVEILINVAAELRRIGCTLFRFVLIGDGPSLPTIRQRIIAERLEEHFALLGLIEDHEQVLQLLAGCDVCVVPDPWTPANDVSAFIKVIEYMGLGRPIVATDLRETRRTAADAALYAPPGDEVEIAKAIMTLMNDPIRRTAMGKRGKERLVSEKIAWDFQREIYISLYDRLIKHL